MPCALGRESPELCLRRDLGSCAGCARACHAAGVPLIVDEAHGAPLAFLRGRGGAPAPALAAGADVSVQSSHKTLSALGQARQAHRAACPGRALSQPPDAHMSAVCVACIRIQGRFYV